MSTGIRYSKHDLISYHASSGGAAPLIAEYGDLMAEFSALEKLNFLSFLVQWQEWDTWLQSENRPGCNLKEFLDRDDPLKETPMTETVYLALWLIATTIDSEDALNLIIAIAHQLQSGIFQQ